MPFTVACAQFSPEKAEIAANLDRIAAITRQACAEGADLVVFPETATSGYFLEGGVLESSLTPPALTHELAVRLGDLPRPIDVTLGFIEQELGGNLYNSAAYLEIASGGGATLRAVYRKFFLPTYGVFDEERFVARGTHLGIVESRFGPVALLICEDVWHSILPTLCAIRGARLLLVPSASPARGFTGKKPDNLDRYERLLRGIAEEHGVFCANAMLCGFEGGKGFVGGSSVIDPFGKVMVQAPVLDDALILATIDLADVEVARAQSPLLSDLKSVWGDIRRAIETVD